MNTRPAPLLLVLLAALALAACSAPAPEAAEIPAPAQAPASPTPRPTWHPKPTKTSPPATATAELAITADPSADQYRTTDEAASSPTATPADAPQLPATTFAGTALVTNGGNVREVPISGKPLDQVNANETVQLIGKNEASSWYLLETPRHTRGWVSATLLRIEPAVAGDVPVAAATTLGSAAPGVTSDWAAHSAGGIHLQLPATWQEVPVSDRAQIEDALRKAEARNPMVGGFLRGFLGSSAESMLQFLGVSDGGAGENVSVLATPRQANIDADQILQFIPGLLKRVVPGVKMLSSDTKHQINGLPTARVVFDIPFGERIAFRVMQWYVIAPNNIYVLTVAGPGDDALLTLGDRIAQSFTTSAGGAATSGAAFQVTNGGNMRREPRVSAANVLGQVCPGDQVAVLERASGGQWVRVRVAVAAAACDPSRVPSGAEGWVNASLLGPITQEARAALPPSLPIARLVPFTHAKTGVSGLRPENWTLFETGDTFQISSSPEAPDGLIGQVITPEESRTRIGQIGRNFAEGPAPEVRENTIGDDGTGTLLITLTGVAQGSTQPVRFTIYARISQAPGGLLFAMATVPADMFPQEEALVRQMVDSLTVSASADGTV